MARRLHKTVTDGGDANTESQQMIAVAHLLKQPKSDDKEMRHLRVKMQADQRDLRTLLEQRMRQAKRKSKERRDKITSIIYNALSPPSQPTDREKTTMLGTMIANNTTYTSIMDVLSQSEALVKEYERLDGMIADLRSRQTGSVADTWKHEIRETEEQLRKGARVAVRNVKKVLGADVRSHEAEMQSGEEEDMNYELQGSLRYAERGIRRMAKALPHERRLE